MFYVLTIIKSFLKKCIKGSWDQTIEEPDPENNLQELGY